MLDENENEENLSEENNNEEQSDLNTESSEELLENSESKEDDESEDIPLGATNELTLPSDVESSVPLMESVPEWNTFTIDEGLGFHALPKETIDSLIEGSKNLKPIVNEIFDLILDACYNNFAFHKIKPTFDQYMAFYQEVNRIVPKLKEKIIYDDCKSTVFFVGDVHGSIEDVFLIINFCFKCIQKDPNVKIIFVGDYVDRNPWDLETLTLIVAFGLLCPHNVVLLRGNHEDRIINMNYGFIDNLLRNFFDDGEQLYNVIIKFFTHLPIMHIAQMYSSDNALGARVLTVHGGIPIDWQNFMEPILIDQIDEKLVCERETSDEMGAICNSILWSDPDEMIQGIVTDGDSGRMKFGKPVFDRFLAANNIHAVVRGHQYWKEGYKIFFDNKLYSIFSASKYNDQKKFDAKILQLEIGKPPKLIPVQKEDLQTELDNQV